MAKKKTTRRTTKKPVRKAAKKATRKTVRKAARKPARKTAKRASTTASRKRIAASKKPRTKSDFFSTIAEGTELSKKQVAEVFEIMGDIIKADLRGPGIANVPGMMKIVVQKKPATRARKGINPFTGEEQMFKAKPARKVVKVRPLKALKDMV